MSVRVLIKTVPIGKKVKTYQNLIFNSPIVLYCVNNSWFYDIMSEAKRTTEGNKLDVKYLDSPDKSEYDKAEYRWDWGGDSGKKAISMEICVRHIINCDDNLLRGMLQCTFYLKKKLNIFIWFSIISNFIVICLLFKFRVIRLQNGLTALLISDLEKAYYDDMSYNDYEEGSSSAKRVKKDVRKV